MEIDREAMEPPYQQLARQLRAGIQSGEYPPGRPLPSKTRLQQELGLTIKTISKAMDVLRAEGLVTTVTGMGIYVIEPKGRG